MTYRDPFHGVPLAILAASLIVLAAPAYAQDQGDATGPRIGAAMSRAMTQFQNLLGELKLTDEQKTQSDDLLKTASEALRKLVADPEKPPREKLEAARQAFENTTGKVRELLSDEQKPVFDAGMERIRQDLRGGASGGAAGIMARFERALASVGLSDEQKPKVRAVIEQANTKFAALREEARADGTDPAMVRQKSMTLRDEAARQISDILTPEQRVAFREALTADRPAAPSTSPAGADRGAPPPAKRDQKTPTTQPESQSANPAPAKTHFTPLAIGQAIPPFSLLQLSGKPLTSDSFAGKPAVILFGSYSSPALRDRIGALQALAEKNRNRAVFVLIYTAEMYPASGAQPARNMDEKIAIAAHESMQDRNAAARTARDALKIKLDIAADTMDDQMQQTLGVGPNGAAVLRADGTLSFRQEWAEPFAIERALAAAIAAK